jgi:hypothetical protein
MKKIILVALMGLFVGSVSFAEGKYSEKKYSHRFNIKKLEKKLDLSSTQVSEIEAVVATFKSRRDDIKKGMQPLKEKFHIEMKSDKKDLTNIRRLLTRISPYHIDMKMAGFEKREAIAGILSEEQLSKFKKMKKGGHKKRGHKKAKACKHK